MLAQVAADEQHHRDGIDQVDFAVAATRSGSRSAVVSVVAQRDARFRVYSYRRKYPAQTRARLLMVRLLRVMRLGIRGRCISFSFLHDIGRAQGIVRVHERILISTNSNFVFYRNWMGES